MNTDQHRLNALTERIINRAYAVANGLGCGFLEKVYENALAHELRKVELCVEQQKMMSVVYDGVIVGEYMGDLVVEGLVLVELKVVKAFDEIHFAQCLNYLRATNLPVCLLINFAKPTIEIKRFAGPSANLH